MREKLGRRARKLQLRRTSLTHYIQVHCQNDVGCSGCEEETGRNTIKLTARTQEDNVQMQLKGEDFARLLFGIESWRRPH